MNAEFTGKQIADRRKALGMTQKALAEKLYVTDKAVSKWERGINFPDLTLMEDLAAVLQTTPAQLLGLENPEQAELLRSLAEISREQAEEARGHARISGWCWIALAVLIAAASFAIGFTRETALQLLYGLWPVCAAGGLWLLIRHGELRPFRTADWAICYLAVIPVLIVCAGYLVLDHGFHDGVNLALECVSAAAVQVLFYRVFRSRIAKALPVIAAAGFLIFHSLDGELPPEFALLGIVCAAAWMICRRKDASPKAPLSKKALLPMLCALLLLTVLCRSGLTRVYVSVFHGSLESYAQSLLSQPDDGSHRYGFWKVAVYPEAGMVEFRTGGSGLVPNSTYEGFYYSQADTHLPFQNADVPMTVNVDSGRWTGEGDNYGSSRRILENWFWFEAHF